VYCPRAGNWTKTRNREQGQEQRTGARRRELGLEQGTGPGAENWCMSRELSRRREWPRLGKGNKARTRELGQEQVIR
jgi:hypothetical protein